MEVRHSSNANISNLLQPFGKIDFNVSQIGFGGYRILPQSKEHKDALCYAIRKGFNLIDTSSNYTGGESERLIGNTLKSMIGNGEISREAVLIVSKAGYVQGENMATAKKREAQGQPFPEMVKYMDGCWHCIHPDFLENQLQRTLGRLQIDNLDIYLLHNPEYFLSHIKQKGLMDLTTARDEYERRIFNAFKWLEKKVKEGKVKAYGISANTFVKPCEDFEFTSLEKVVKIAESITPDHNFKVIQFPLNLFETGACLEKNQSGSTKTLIEFAVEKNIATMVNRPLNAIAENTMVRLASFDEIDPSKIIIENFSMQQKKVMECESRFQTDFKSKWPKELSLIPLNRLFSIPYYLSSALIEIHGWEQWDYEKEYRIMPQLYDDLNYLNNIMQHAAHWKKWVLEFSHSLLKLLDITTASFKTSKSTFSEMFSKRLDTLDSALKSSASLSQKSLRILSSIPGINCVLLGMRKKDYVDDALAALKEPTLQNAAQILSSISKNQLIKQWKQ